MRGQRIGMGFEIISDRCANHTFAAFLNVCVLTLFAMTQGWSSANVF